MEKIADPKKLIEAKRLLLTSPEGIYSYMEACKDERLLYELADILLERNEELIHLAVARFTNNGEILERLFKTSTDEAIRCAVLGNPKLPLDLFGSIDERPHLIEVLETGTQAEVGALVTNLSLKGQSLADVFKREGWASHLTDGRWFLCSILALDNPNLKSEWESNAPIGYGEGYQSYEHDKALGGAWHLLLNAPLTKEWAVNLEHQFGNRKVIHYYGADDAFYRKVLARWTSESEELEKSFEDLRMWIASTVPAYLRELHEWLANHDDRALRVGHYYSFDTHVDKDLDKYYEKDASDFIHAALSNEHLFMHKKVREHLRELVEREDSKKIFAGDLLDDFDIVFQRISNRHPDLLSDEERLEKESGEPVSIGLLREQCGELLSRLDQLEETLLERLSRPEQVELSPSWSEVENTQIEKEFSADSSVANSEDISHETDDFSTRILCSDGSCIGVIGADGHCKRCGKPYPSHEIP